MVTLFTLCAALLGQAFAADVPADDACLKAYISPDYQNVWNISRDDWSVGCKDKKPEDVLAQAKEKFIKACIEAVPEPLKIGLTVERLRGYCREGNPGKAKILSLQAAGTAKAVQGVSAKFDSTIKAIQGHLANDVASIYGEKSGNAGMAVDVPNKPTQTLAPAVETAPHRTEIQPPDDSGDIGVLQRRIIADGVSREAVDTAKALLHGMLSGADPKIAAKLVDARLSIVIIPKKKKMTDLPYFAHMKGTKTFDGRLWDDVRGTHISMGNDGEFVAAPEENLIGNPSPSHPEGYVFIHEMAHAVQDCGLESSFLEKLQAFLMRRGDEPATIAESYRLYEAAMERKEKSGLDSYADSNPDEYFAQATVYYFGYHPARDIWKTNPDMALFLSKVYGPPKVLKP